MTRGLLPSRRIDYGSAVSAFFFQAEGGIRGTSVTGVQTCALPILEYASRQINSIEINGSFYSLQRPQSYRQWYDETPDDFVFAMKGGRYITHMLKLRNVERPLANFFASGPLCLNEKMGPILWQFPPQMGFNPERFEAFFKMLPRDTEQAAHLAKGHDDRLK